MKKKLLTALMAVLVLVFFTAACWVLYRELHQFKIGDIKQTLSEFPKIRLLLGLLFTALSYSALIGYDYFGLRYAKARLPFGTVAQTSLVSYIFSNNVGVAAFSGSAIRYRFYSLAGLSVQEILKVIFFGFLTFWTGLLFSSAVVFSIFPSALPEKFPIDNTRPVGIVLGAVIAAYIFVVFLWKKPVRIKKVDYKLPSPGIVMFQLPLAFLDWLFSSLVLYVLLPESLNITFPVFFSSFIFSQLFGLFSNVPGGTGVFESAFMVSFSGLAPASEIFSALLFYRLVYYIIPLFVAMLLFAKHEITAQWKKEIKFFTGIKRFYNLIIPKLFSVLTFLAGMILIFSGVLPAVPERIHWLFMIIPFPVMELSHFLGSITGFGLLVLSLGLWKRMDSSFVLTLILLVLGALFSLFKGFDYEEALSLTLLFLILLPGRSAFYRKTKLTADVFSAQWLIFVLLVLVSSFWIGLFAYKHVEYSHDLWWTFELDGDASRFLRATIGLSLPVFCFSLFALFRSGKPKLVPLSKEEFYKIEELLKKSRHTSDNLAYLPDKYFLLKYPEAFLMYNVSGVNWFCLGDPVGDEAAIRELIWQFRETAERHGGRAVFYEIGRTWLPLYIELGYMMIKLGEEACVKLPEFSIKGKHFQFARNSINKLEGEGFRFEIIEKTELGQYLPELKTVSDSWLKEKRFREKGFSLGYFDEEYLLHFDMAVVRKDKRILAFANLWDAPDAGEYSIDLMRHSKDAPHSLMDYLFIKLMLYAQNRGYKIFNLGMAPLSGLPTGYGAPLWGRLGNTVFHQAGNFYNFEGLRKFKEKFRPLWSPRFAAVPNLYSLPGVMKDITLLIGGLRKS